jgi:hypothetical protein
MVLRVAHGYKRIRTNFLVSVNRCMHSDNGDPMITSSATSISAFDDEAAVTIFSNLHHQDGVLSD